MNIMNLFRSEPAPATPATPTTPAANSPSQAANPGTPLPGTQASDKTAPNGVVPTASPLDSFKDIWQTPDNAKADPSPEVFANVDPQKLMESASKIDFKKVISAENLQAISSGGEAAVTAFAEAMNKVAQTVYAQSAFATTKIVDQALAKAQEGYDTRLPALIKKLSVNENLQDQNPLLSNPALTPLVSALSEQLVRKNPNATASEIQQQVNDYFAALGTSFAPKPPETPASRAASKAAKQEDWSAFLGS